MNNADSSTPNLAKTNGSFEELLEKEYRFIDGPPPKAQAEAAKPDAAAAQPPKDPVVVDFEVTDEPWVSFTSKDRVGIALSGGGIRSSSFNLGLLQGLRNRRLLKHASYLSTVSGGGYAGGFWTAWRLRHGAGAIFPTCNPGAAGHPTDRASEPLPIRHLREFSRFLMPRVGILRMDVWKGIVTILGGLLPSLLASVAVLAAVAYLWYGVAYSLLNVGAWVGGGLLAVVAAVYFWLAEHAFHRGAAHGGARVGYGVYLVLAAIAALLIGALWVAASEPWVRDRPPCLACLDGGLVNLEWPPDWGVFISNFAPYVPSLVLAAAGIVLIFVRTLLSRFAPEFSRGDSKALAAPWAEPMDRLIARCFLPALVWLGLALIWDLSLWIADRSGIPGTGAATVGTGALFVMVRSWLEKPDDRTHGSALLEIAAKRLKPVVPQILAAAAVLLMYAMVCILVQSFGMDSHLPWGAGLVVIVIAATIFLFNPAMVGMHDFYRARICRCFLGASNADIPPFDRKTDEQPGDDLRLRDLRPIDDPQPEGPQTGAPRRHLHLVCCTANNLEGDPLANLYRGSRSAVLSPFGISLGNRFAELDRLRFSSALTASAAAFNSQMGRHSVKFGPAVSFLMSSLNLRLGLWVKHPLEAKRENRVTPGWPFFLEMFGFTKCDPIRRAMPASSGKSGGQQAAAAAPVSRGARDLHLSDGGHFENLGLYELVRRHCRYIVVSDCGADQRVVFDDLAIALRTIREDFGVEIELDVSPLRPGADGRARQHAVVGTVHYNGRDGWDKGTLLYLKPSLTGDESADITQYQARNPAFPHEPTSDQFYDEAQWESYRCLGQHAAEASLGFVAGYTHDQYPGCRFVENVFLDATRFLGLPPPRDSEELLALTERCTELDTDVRDHAPAALRSEFFPEIAASYDPVRVHADDPHVQMRTIYYLMIASQLLENIWICARLDAYGAHPSNDGWMNYFSRWTSTASFRRWWPILSPLYSLGFREFIRDRFDLDYRDANRPDSRGAWFRLQQLAGRPQGLAWDDLSRRRPELRTEAGVRAGFEFFLIPDGDTGSAAVKWLQVGLLLFEKDSAGTPPVISWNSRDLFVPPSLSGSGINAEFLDKVIEYYSSDDYSSQKIRLRVVFDWPDALASPSWRQQRLHDINFYRSRGFVCECAAGDHGRLVLVCQLPRPKPPEAG